MFSQKDKRQRKAAPSIWSFDSGYISSEPQADSSVAPQDDQDLPSTTAIENQSGISFPFFDDTNGEYKSPNFWNVLVGGEHVRLQRDQQVAPQVTKVNVFTSKDCSRTNSIFVAHGQIADQDRACVACELWAITNPGEDILCDKCRPLVPQDISSSRTRGIFQLEPATSTLKIDQTFPNLSPSNQSPALRSPTPPTEGYNSAGVCSPTWPFPPPTSQPLPNSPKDQRCSACELSALMCPEQPLQCASCIGTVASSSSKQLKSCKITRSRARRGFKLPSNALEKLQGWLDANQHDPYPTAEVKKQLAQECGITEKQVTTWFTNARARQLNAMETWQSSNSDDDASSESEGYESHHTQGCHSKSNNHSRPVQPTVDTSYSRAGSVSGSSAYNAFSPISSTRSPLGPAPSRRGKKKNYRKQPYTTNVPDQAISPHSHAPQYTPGDFYTAQVSKQPSQENWQCTFCLKTLSPKSWRRHEETQHLPRSKWSCMLFGPRLSISRGSTSRCCAFCMQKDPSDEHFHSSHRISECAARPLQDRTFYRPDHLRQHIKNYHNSTLFDVTAAKWKSAAEDTRGGGWTCGFCAISLPDWNTREVHIAGHFRDGMTMDQWRLPKQPQTQQNIKTRRPSFQATMDSPFSAIATSASTNVSFAPAIPTTLNDTLDSIFLRTPGNRLDDQLATDPAPMDGFHETYGCINLWPDLSNSTLPSIADDNNNMYGFGDFMTEDAHWNGGL